MLVWLLLLAVPFQGFASASMLICAPLSSMSASTVLADSHSAGVADATVAGEKLSEHCQALAERHPDDTKSKAEHNPSSKCNSCASCHVGVALVSSELYRMPVEVQQTSAIPFAPAFVATVHLDRAERPPQKLFL